MSEVLNSISAEDREYINIMRGISITRVVLVHLGLSWFFTPYSQFVNVFLPVLFFVSGGVTFFSFRRSANTSRYLINRLITIYVPYSLIIVSSFLVLWLYQGNIPNLNLEAVAQWFTFNPHAFRETMPFPLGQVWFLHSLVMIIIISPIFFSLSLKNSMWLVVPIIISVVLSIFQHFSEYGRHLFLMDHNVYQPLVNMGFFFLGAFYFLYRKWFTTTINGIVMITFLIFGVITGLIQSQDMLMSKHIYAPDFYYLSCSFSAIFLFLTLQKQIMLVCNTITPFKWFFLFMSRHSYSVFLLHSLVLIKVHVWFDLGDIAGDPVRALIKIILVIFFTCLLAVPVTRLSNVVTKYIKSLIFEKENKGIVQRA